MIHHWKWLDTEITVFEYQYDPMPSCKFIPCQTSMYVIWCYFFIMGEGVEHPTSFVEASQKNQKLDK